MTPRRAPLATPDIIRPDREGGGILQHKEIYEIKLSPSG